MRVLICGDRNWRDERIIYSWLCKLQDWGYTTVIEGEARGADSIARELAEKMGFKVIKFPANWRRYGRAAGPIRNRQMLVEGRPNLVIAFHNDIEHSKGTKNMIEQARKAGIRVIVEKA